MKAMLPSTDSISNNPSTTHTASNTVGMLLFFSVFDGSYSDQKWMFVYYSSIESSEQQFIIITPHQIKMMLLTILSRNSNMTAASNPVISVCTTR